MKNATNKELTAYITAYLVAVGIVHVTPGPWNHWSKGRAVDTWTLTHILWGFIGAKMNQSLGQQMILATLNEVAEAIIRKQRPDLTWGTPEPDFNVPMDLIANAAGWYLGSTKN